MSSARCEPDIYADGTAVAVVCGPRGHTIEDWVVTVAKRSGQKVDWHFVGGRAVILVLGDEARVRAEIEASWQDLVDAYLTCTDNFCATPFKAKNVQRIWL